MKGLSAEEYKIAQLSVFLENRAGCLRKILGLLSQAAINIRAISLADTSDFGILRMLASDTDLAERLLKENGFNAGRASVIAVDMPDVPGSLEKIVGLVSCDDINVEYMYVFAPKELDRTIMIFRFDKIDRAIQLLSGEARLLRHADLFGASATSF